MPELLQHVVALTVVAISVGYVGWQGVQTLRGQRGANCCATGGGPRSEPTTATTGKAKSSRPPLVYIPVESLSRRRKG